MSNVDELLTRLENENEFIVQLTAAEVAEWCTRQEEYNRVTRAEIAYLVDKCQRACPQGVFHVGNEGSLVVYFDTMIPFTLATTPATARVGFAFNRLRKVEIADEMELQAGHDYIYSFLLDCNYTHLDGINNDNFVMRFWWD